MKINRIFVVLMAVIFIGSQPMAVLAEDVSNEIEDVSNETEELLNETEDVANETENVSDEAETVSDETAESAGLRDQSGFVENISILQFSVLDMEMMFLIKMIKNGSITYLSVQD